MISAQDAPLVGGSRLSRGTFGLIGCLLVGLGTVGIVVPGLPTTIFFILALWCFKKSSKRMEDWLLNHRLVGPTLRDWDESRSLTMRAKAFSITAIWVCICVSIVLIATTWVQVMLVCIAVALTWYLASRPTKVRTQPNAA